MTTTFTPLNCLKQCEELSNADLLSQFSNLLVNSCSIDSIVSEYSRIYSFCFVFCQKFDPEFVKSFIELNIESVVKNIIGVTENKFERTKLFHKIYLKYCSALVHYDDLIAYFNDYSDSNQFFAKSFLSQLDEFEFIDQNPNSNSQFLTFNAFTFKVHDKENAMRKKFLDEFSAMIDSKYDHIASQTCLVCIMKIFKEIVQYILLFFGFYPNTYETDFLISKCYSRLLMVNEFVSCSLECNLAPLKKFGIDILLKLLNSTAESLKIEPSRVETYNHMSGEMISEKIFRKISKFFYSEAQNPEKLVHFCSLLLSISQMITNTFPDLFDISKFMDLDENFTFCDLLIKTFDHKFYVQTAENSLGDEMIDDLDMDPSAMDLEKKNSLASHNFEVYKTNGLWDEDMQMIRGVQRKANEFTLKYIENLMEKFKTQSIDIYYEFQRLKMFGKILQLDFDNSLKIDSLADSLSRTLKVNTFFLHNNYYKIWLQFGDSELFFLMAYKYFMIPMEYLDKMYGPNAVEFKMPAFISKAYYKPFDDFFNKFTDTFHSGEGTVEVNLKGENSSIDLKTNCWTASILIMFDTKNGYTMDEIVSKTEFPQKTVENSLNWLIDRDIMITDGENYHIVV